ncbi:MAG: glycosyl transferase [Bacteroidetes bacterium RBG_13_46_8]|nr:MAG: glycosyl transferase [Bacteroidetes bacterium RBG_13_46_8]
MKVKLSGVIITFNEEKNIERCLLSLKDIVDEIVVIDSFSTDRTKGICEKYNVRFIQNPFKGHVEQKNKALDSARHSYVLSLDADEELSPRLKKSIVRIKENWNADGYYFNRLTNFCGTWIRHSGWYPDRKLRLWNREKGRWGGLNPHDRVMMKPGSQLHFLRGDLNHYSYTTTDEFTERTRKYSLIGARSLFQQGKKPSYLKLVFSPAWRFIKHYVAGLGFLDGYNGLLISRTLAKGVYLKYKELFHLYQQNKTNS